MTTIEAYSLGKLNSKELYNVLILGIKSITRSFIMLNTMMENENTSFANISISFLGSVYILCFHFPS